MDGIARTRLTDRLNAELDTLHDQLPETRDPTDKRRINNRVRNIHLRLARLRGRHTCDQWEAIVAETAGICVKCGYQHDMSYERPCKGYVIPLAAGGSDGVDNIQPLCRSCVTGGGDGFNYLTAWRTERLNAPVGEGA